MAVQPSDDPGHLSGLDVTPDSRLEVMRRARLLCLQAEPHTHELPCGTHRNEAERLTFHPG